MKRLLVAALLLISSLGRPHAAVLVQAPCRAPAPPAPRESNIFTPAQESDLGDAIAERYESSFRIIEDEALTAPLRQMGDRVVSHLPPTDLRIKFMLTDIPEANAFVLPGGRIYVSRKLIGFARSEDELAGVLGHELGHLVARQQSIDITRRLKDVIGVTAVGDRADVFEKYNRLTDNAGRKPGAMKSGGREDGDQIEADRIGLFAVAAAGYDPQAQIKLFDRLTGTEGKTGSFLSRMLGSVNPDAKRLGEMLKNVATVPAGCTEARGPGDAQKYQDWQASVLSFSGLGRKESLHGVVGRFDLTPALRGEVTQLRFSPDGRYALAQDDAGIAVLAREPFVFLFRIDAPDAEPAQFTPDSREVIFQTSGLRVEHWRVAEHKLVEVHDVVWRTNCHETALSPDGRTLACLDTKFDLSLIDVASGAPVLQKKAFFNPAATINLLSMLVQYGAQVSLGSRDLVTMRFSPDSRFFVAGYRDLDQGTALAYDLQAKALLTLKNPARKLATDSFTFVGPDRLLGVNPDDPAKSGIFRLPGGDIVEQLALPLGGLTAATNPNAVLVRPNQKNALGVFDLTTRSVTKTNARAAFDVYEQSFVAELDGGTIGLFKMGEDRPVKEVSLPAGPLGRIRAATISNDFQWLAVSERSRGAVWDLAAHRRVAYVRGFNGAFFDNSGLFFADWPRMGGDPHSILRLNPALGQATTTEIKERLAEQTGEWLLATTPVPENVAYPSGATYQLRDVRLPAPIWTRAYPKDPPDAWIHPGTDGVVFTWDAASPPGRELIRTDPSLRGTVNQGDLEGDYILEVVAIESGRLRRRMLLETGKGSFQIDEICTVGDWMLVSDTIGRVLVYSLTTGELKGYAIGSEPVLSPAAGLLAVDAGGGRLVLYDLQTLRPREDYTFTHPLALTSFSPDGKRLFVLTADQQAFVIEPGK